jgi:hypothetical protein
MQDEHSYYTLIPLKQAIIRKNRLSPSKVVINLVGACIAGNAKNKRNWRTLPRNFSATAGDKNFKLVPKLVLGYVLYVHILLVEFWEGVYRTMLKFLFVAQKYFCADHTGFRIKRKIAILTIFPYIFDRKWPKLWKKSWSAAQIPTWVGLPCLDLLKPIRKECATVE